MTVATDIHADLVTPLGAYLRLRAAGTASFLLESVDNGRLGRYSLVGSGTRLVSFDEAEAEVAAGRPVVGYLGYDHVATLEPTVPLPADGPDLPESRFVIADRLVRFDHTTSVAEVLAGDRDEIARTLDAPAPPDVSGRKPAGHGRTRRVPERRVYEAGVRRIQELIRAGDAFQVVLSQRAERPTPAFAVELYRALRRINPSPYLFLLELDGVGRRRRRAAPRLGEGPRGAHHARRPWTKRPLAGLSSRHCPHRDLPAARAVLACDASRLGGRGRARARADGLRPPAGVLPCRDRLGSPEGARHADRVRARGLPTRPVRRRGRLRAARRLARHVHRDPA